MMIKHISEYFHNGKGIPQDRPGRRRKRGERSAGGNLTERPRDSVAMKGSFVYFILGGHPAVKVGRTTNLTSRMAGIQNGNAETVRVAGLLSIPSVDDAKIVERFLHKKFKEAGRHIGGEWFRLEQREIESACQLCEREFAGKASVHFIASVGDEQEPTNDNASYISGGGFTCRNRGLR